MPSSSAAKTTTRRLYSTTLNGSAQTSNTVFLSKCREAIRSKRAQLPSSKSMPPSVNDGQMQKTLVPYYVKPRTNASLSVSLPTSMFDSRNLETRFEREQKSETEIWVKAAYLYEYQQAQGKSSRIKLKPFVETFMKTGRADPYLSYYLEKHKDKLRPIARELSLKRNEILKHTTFGALEDSIKNAAEEEIFMRTDLSNGSVGNRVTIQDLKAAVAKIKEASTTEDQVIAVQHYMGLREKYVKPSTAQDSAANSTATSSLTHTEAHQKQVQAQIQHLFDEIIIKKRDPAELAPQIRLLKSNYQKLQKMCLPSEELDLFDIYALEKNIMNSSDAAKRFLKQARKNKKAGSWSSADEEHLFKKFLDEREKSIVDSLPSDRHRKIRQAYLAANARRQALESAAPSLVQYKEQAEGAFKNFITSHAEFINGTLDLLSEEQPEEFKPLFSTLKSLYQEKQKITQNSGPFRNPTDFETAFESLSVDDRTNVAQEVQNYSDLRAKQRSYLEEHYAKCREILSAEKYHSTFQEQLHVLQSRVYNDEALSSALKELQEMAEDVIQQQGLQQYEQSVGTADSFERDLSHLSRVGKLSKYVKRSNSLETVFGVNAIDESLALMDTYNVALEPPRYRSYLQSGVPSYKLRYVDTYSAHPTKKQRRHDRKVQLRVYKKALQEKLSEKALDRFIHISGPRYRADKGELLLTSEIFPTRQENHQYVVNLLGALVREAQKADLDQRFAIPERSEKLSSLEKLALEYPSLDEEDAQSHNLLAHWVGYYRKGKIAGADELYGEGLEHQEDIVFEEASTTDVIDFDNIEEVSREEFEELMQKLGDGNQPDLPKSRKRGSNNSVEEQV